MSAATKVQTTFGLTVFPPTIALPTFNKTFYITKISLTAFVPINNGPCCTIPLD
jgi:hypothetical protein